MLAGAQIAALRSNVLLYTRHVDDTAYRMYVWPATAVVLRSLQYGTPRRQGMFMKATHRLSGRIAQKLPMLLQILRS